MLIAKHFRRSNPECEMHNRRAFCMRMRATAVQRGSDCGNQNGAENSNCTFHVHFGVISY